MIKILLSDYVETRWNSKNKKRYVNAGYEFTKMGDIVHISINDMFKGSNEPVYVKCDYCGCVFKKGFDRYLKEHGNMGKDACKQCKNKKAKDHFIEVYGVENPFMLCDVKEKIKDYNIQKYGCENPFMSEEIKEKIKTTNIEKYWFCSAMKNADVKQKAINTRREREKSGMIVYKHGEDCHNWKGGVKHSRQERASHEYIVWRRKVFNSAGYICSVCGKHTHDLNAHHIYNWKDFPEKRYDVNNGACMCSSCHYRFHSIYGKRIIIKNSILSISKW